MHTKLKQQISDNLFRSGKQKQHFQYSLNSHGAFFVKYIGFTDSENLVFVQDNQLTNYYFNSSDLVLKKQLVGKKRVLDVCGSGEYVMQALDGKQVVIFARKTFEWVRTITTNE